MSFGAIFGATALIGAVGLLIGVFLTAAGKKFAVEVDPREVAVREALPGNNCGGCGYPGCDGLAEAIAKGEAAVDACPVGGSEVGNIIAGIMGQAGRESVRMAAFVKCSGTCDRVKNLYDYTGVQDCEMASLLPGAGIKACSYGCLGFGSCVKVCKFDAIHIVNGVAVIDREACKDCGMCILKCPRHLIELLPYDQGAVVACNSKARGKEVMNACTVGCIGCKKCERTCPQKAIRVDDNLPRIYASLCVGCGECAKACPRHIIQVKASGEAEIKISA